MGNVFLGREERMERVCDQLIRLAGEGRCRIVDVFDGSFLREREEAYALANFETQRLYEDGMIYNDENQEGIAEWYARYKEKKESELLNASMLSEESDVYHAGVRDQLLKSISEGTRTSRSLRATLDESDKEYFLTFVCEGFKRSDLDVTCRDGFLRVYGKRITANGVDEVSRMVPVKHADAGSMSIQMICEVLVVTLNKRN